MKHFDIVEKVIVYIITRDIDELTGLTKYQLAGMFDINKNYLTERFKKEMNMTVFDFIDFEKMKRAEKMLVTRYDLSVEEISRRMGIARCKHFRRKFRKIYGLNPGKYRLLFKNQRIRLY